MDLFQSLRGFFILGVVTFGLLIASAYYFVVESSAEIDKARDPYASRNRGVTDATQHYRDGIVSFVPIYVEGEGCVHPGISESDFQGRYATNDPTPYYHGCSRRSLMEHDLIGFHKINEWYAFAYNRTMSQLIDADANHSMANSHRQ